MVLGLGIQKRHFSKKRGKPHGQGLSLFLLRLSETFQLLILLGFVWSFFDVMVTKMVTVSW